MQGRARADWQPGASLETLRARAEILRSIRAFFAERGVLEVDTPQLSRHGTVDRHVESLPAGTAAWLHTSPEFAMKRLLAAGSGPIFQLCHVFRHDEAGRFHNPEFMMLEWYRPGWDHHRLMDEVDDLLHGLIPGAAAFERLSYREAFRRHAGLDPFDADLPSLRTRCAKWTDLDVDERDVYLDLLMSVCVGPALGGRAPCFVYDYPAAQAALARIRREEGVAERFEVFWKGLELANGFHELTDSAEQRARFVADRQWRQAQGRAAPPYDANLIAALEAGMPESAGVALGVDRLLMLLLDLPDVAAAMPFSFERA